MKKLNNKKIDDVEEEASIEPVAKKTFHSDIKRSLIAVISIGLSVFFVLLAINVAGSAGILAFSVLKRLFGIGYFLLPFIAFIVGISYLASKETFFKSTFLGSLFLVVSILGILDVVLPEKSGFFGRIFGSPKLIFNDIAAVVILVVLFLAGVIIEFNISFVLKKPTLKTEQALKINEPIQSAMVEAKKGLVVAENISITQDKEDDERFPKKEGAIKQFGTAEEVALSEQSKTKTAYQSPPLSLLNSKIEKPSAGDLRANANIIRRTLESFGIPVEMGEITIGPKVTRYTLKPAEGVKLSKITTLSQDLALALAAHPIRLEAPIPGKSFVGVEVPNKSGAIVRLGSLLNTDEFQKSGPLTFIIGRDINGDVMPADVEKMPHLLIAGATGSGKSIMIHNIIISFLYRNSPEILKLVLIDPKKVELSAYNGLPHLIVPVITENKKSLGVLRWAISEMERRYDILLQDGSRDINSFNKKHFGDPISYIVIIIDELADLMTSYGQEVEGLIIRLAQMARATGIHLIVSTQRPSVEIVTGLIKANITNRIALQVASQVDSRTILDIGGAEKLLGAGDLLFISGELSKPKRIQGAYVSEEEIQRVVSFIKKQRLTSEINEAELFGEINGNAAAGDINLGGQLDALAEDEYDPLFDEAVQTVKEMKRASASLLQRKLKIGYARAARLLDIMEHKGLIGPVQGAKPREVFIADDEDGAVN